MQKTAEEFDIFDDRSKAKTFKEKKSSIECASYQQGSKNSENDSGNKFP